MTVVFGCISYMSRARTAYKSLEENLDMRKGMISYIQNSDTCVGIQVDPRTQNHIFSPKENKISTLLVSDYPQENCQMFAENAASSYSREGFTGLQKCLGDSKCDDFLLVLYDHNRKKLVISCDPFGIRKIFYSEIPTGYLFTSCPDHLVATEKSMNVLPNTLEDEELDTQVMTAFLLHGSIPPGRSLFRRIRKSIPGTMMLFTKQDKLLNEFFWPNPFSEPRHNTRTTGCGCNEDFALLARATNNRLEKNETNGVLISGGLDSALIASLLNRISDSQKTVALTLSYKGYYDESSEAQEITDFLGLRLINMEIPRDENYLLQVYQQSVESMEEPSARTSYMSRYIAFKAIKDFCSAVWLGEGGDEIFVGYTPITWKYDENLLIRFLSSFPPKFPTAIGKVCSNPRFMHRYADMVRYVEIARNDRLLFKLISESSENIRFTEQVCGSKFDLLSLLRETYYAPVETTIKRFKETDKLSQESLLLLSTLAHTDIMIDQSFSSKMNIKVKFPFLDRCVVDSFLRKPAKEKLSGKVTKLGIRKMARSLGLLPEKTIGRRKSWFLSPQFFFEGEQFGKHLLEVTKLLLQSTHSAFISALAQKVQEDINKGKIKGLNNAATLLEFLTRYI